MRHAYRASEGSFARGVLSALLIYLAIFAGALGFWVALDFGLQSVKALLRGWGVEL